MSERPYEGDGSRGHEWQRDEYGEVDLFAYYPRDPHNGPRCIRCGYGFCDHCTELPEKHCAAAAPTRGTPEGETRA